MHRTAKTWPPQIGIKLHLHPIASAIRVPIMIGEILRLRGLSGEAGHSENKRKQCNARDISGFHRYPLTDVACVYFYWALTEAGVRQHLLRFLSIKV